MSKFTPGPWRKEDHRDSGDWRSSGPVWAETHGDYHPGTRICSMNWDGVSAESQREKIEEIEANANLIAAAPEMLEALENFDSAFTSFNPEEKSSRDEMRKAVINARSAIKKAKGES